MPLPEARFALSPPPALANLSGVLGVGYGLKETAHALTEARAWRVYVHRKMPRSQLSAGALVPTSLDGVPTDVVEWAPARPSSGMESPPPNGARIANARGVPGTLGCLGVTLHDDRPVLLTNHHVLFGAGAAVGDPIWLVGEPGIAAFRRAGRSLYGRLGTVTCRGDAQHVDCALGLFDGDEVPPPEWHAFADDRTAAPAAPGDRVRKSGGATGTTEGVVVDVVYPEVVFVDGRARPAPRQILVRPLAEGVPFSAEGDSGAVLWDARRCAVGLLWGVNHRGESVACHMAPVLEVLNLRLTPAEAAVVEPPPPSALAPATRRLRHVIARPEGEVG